MKILKVEKWLTETWGWITEMAKTPPSAPPPGQCGRDSHDAETRQPDDQRLFTVTKAGCPAPRAQQIWSLGRAASGFLDPSLLVSSCGRDGTESRFLLSPFIRVVTPP